MNQLNNGRDSSLFVAVINEMPDKYIMELSGGSRIYGQEYINKFCKNLLIYIEELWPNVDLFVDKIIVFEDIVEKI